MKAISQHVLVTCVSLCFSKTNGNSDRFYLFGSKITVDIDCSQDDDSLEGKLEQI